jgi:hypothetical protein
MTETAELSDVEKRVELVMSSDTLMGDIRDVILDRLKAMPKPWTVMSENEQRDLIYGVESAAENLIRRAALLIAANGYPIIEGRVEQSALKDDIKTVVRVSKHHPDRLSLLDAAGHSCIIVIADVAQFMGERAPAEPDPEQPELDIPVADNGAATAAEPGEDVPGNVKPFKSKNKPVDGE